MKRISINKLEQSNSNLNRIKDQKNLLKREKINTAKPIKPFEQGNKLSHAEIKQIAKNYKRIGTDYYLNTSVLTAKKKKVRILKRWSKSTIKDDHGSSVLDQIEKFYDFTLVPDNSENYQRNIGGCYNMYEPINHKPLKGEFPITLDFLKHIFGDYFDLGIDYLTILHQLPAEKLPALCLVSKEQKTGKTTFLKWLTEIYGDNAVTLGNEDFGSNFNTSWSSKLVVGIDESFIEKRIIKEKIKRLITDDTILSENKGVDKVRRDFFAKFILNSNNEDNFIQMDKEDNRFFVLKVPSVSKENPLLLDLLIKEIPAYLFFLQNRSITYKRQSRLWFNPKDYETDALRAIVKSSKSIIEKEMLDYLTDLADNLKTLDEYKDHKEINITPTRIADTIKQNIRYSQGLGRRVGEILRDWGLSPNQKSDRYKYPVFDEENISGTITRVLKFKGETGKYYSISFDKLEQLSNE